MWCTYVQKFDVIILDRVPGEEARAAHYGRILRLAREKLVFGHIAVFDEVRPRQKPVSGTNINIHSLFCTPKTSRHGTSELSSS